MLFKLFSGPLDGKLIEAEIDGPVEMFRISICEPVKFFLSHSPTEPIKTFTYEFVGFDRERIAQMVLQTSSS